MSPIQRYFSSVQQGRGYWWHWLLGVAFILAIYFGLIFVIAIPYGIALATSDIYEPSLLNYGFLLTTFLPLFFGVWLVQRVWHQRSLTQLLTYTSRFRWRYFWNACIVFTVVLAVMSAVKTLIWPEVWDKYQLNTNWELVIYGGLLTLLLIPFQAASEEFLVRGYLNQAFIKYLKSPWIVFIITSAFFASLHYWNSEAEGQVWPYMAAIFMFGFAACILLYFEGGLESAIGLHIFNNIFAFSIMGYEDPGMPNIAIMYSGRPEIGWTEVGWEFVSLLLMVAGILWLNRRTGSKAEETDYMDDTFN